MTFLAPWALLAGVLAAAGLVVLHLVARQRPAAYPLPTARFVPDRRTLVSRVSSRPRDLWLLLLRIVLVLSAAAAFARPVLTPTRAARARVVLVDRSAAVADPAEVARRAREVMKDDAPTRVLVFDTSVTVLDAGVRSLDSLLASSRSGRTNVVGSLSAALVAARRIGADVGARADSVELVLVSPVTSGELDAATDTLRAAWPGGLRVVRVAAAADTASPPALEHAVGEADVLGPALAERNVGSSSRAVRLVRAPASTDDSAFARSGGTVVRWDSIGARSPASAAVAMGDDVVVALLARRSIRGEGVVLARWADGSPAATEEPLGKGCLRDVAIGVPLAGDLPLSPAFQRLVNGLTDACAGARARVGAPPDSARVAAFAGSMSAANGAALANGTERPTPLAPWLLGLALACALTELLLRRSSEPRLAPEEA